MASAAGVLTSCQPHDGGRKQAAIIHVFFATLSSGREEKPLTEYHSSPISATPQPSGSVRLLVSSCHVAYTPYQTTHNLFLFVEDGESVVKPASTGTSRARLDL
jgi:hypothetical protein